MKINPNLSTDPSAAGLRNARPLATANPSTASTPSTPPQLDLARWPALDGDTTVPDSAGADASAQYAQSNFLAQPALALAAQANLNPDSAYTLLQS